MSGELDEKEKRVEVITNALLHLPIRGKELELAARQVELALSQGAHLAASPSPSMEMGVVFEGDLPMAISEIGHLQSALAAMRAQVEAAQEAENEAKDCFWAVYPTYCEVKGHGISTEVARTELAAQVQRLTEENEALRKERDEAKQELQAHDLSFDLRYKSDMRACKRWQEATGRTMTLPDHTDLSMWLFSQLEAAEARIKALEEALRAVSDTSHVAPGKGYYRLPWPIMEKVDATLKENAL